MKIQVLDHGYVELRNLAGPVRRPDQPFDADDTDPANAARFSFDGADEGRTREEDLRLADYLLRNRHTTPFEMVEVWIEMQMPIFVARQFVRHRTVSINEVSARYTQLPNKFYIPEVENIGVKSESNKQGRTIEPPGTSKDLGTASNFCGRLSNHCDFAYDEYARAIGAGIPAELARCFLPLNVYTKWLWNQDLHNLMHFLKLRRHEHAQFEARQYADAIHQLLSENLPATMQLFDKYYG